MTLISTRPSIGGDALQARRRGGSVKPGYVGSVLTDHPLAFWPLDDPAGSITARDLSGHVNPGDVAQVHQTLIFGVSGFTTDGATALQQTTNPTNANPPSVQNTTVAIGTGDRPFTLEIAAKAVNMSITPVLITVGGHAGDKTVGGLYLDPIELHLYAPGFDIAWAHHVDPSLPTWHLYGVSSDGAGGFAGYLDGNDLGPPVIAGAGPRNFALPGLAVLGGVNIQTWDGPATVAMAALYDHVVPAARMLAHAMAR